MKTLLWVILLISLFSINCKKENPIQPELITVNIDQPAKNSSVYDSVKIKISANGASKIERIELYIDNFKRTHFTKEPYSYVWYTRFYEEGSQHILLAKAYDSDGNIATSKAVLVYVYRFQPSNLSALLLTDSTAVLSWSDNSSFETGYEIEESINSDVFKLIKTDSANTTTDTLSAMFSYGNSYRFRVRAISDSSYSLYSNIAYAQIYLPAPSDLNLVFSSDTAATLTWKDNSFYENGFYIYDPYFNIYSPIDTLSKNSTSTTIYGKFYTNIIYHFEVRAYSGIGISSSSGTVASSPKLDAPINLTFSKISKSEIQLNWQDNSTFEKGFIIERFYNSGPYTELTRVSNNVISYIDNNLDTTKIYNYRIKAYTDLNSSDYSNEIKVSYSIILSTYKTFNITNFNEIDETQTFYYSSSNGYQINLHSLSDGASLKTFNATLDTAKFQNTYVGLPYKASAFNSSWTKLAVGGITIDYFDVSNNYKIATWNGTSGFSSLNSPPNKINDLTFTKDNSTLITCQNDSTIKYWDLNNQSMIKEIKLNFEVESFRLSQDGSKIIAKIKNGNIKILSSADGSFLYDLQNSNDVSNYKISKDGNYIFSNTSVNSFILWQLNNGSVYKTWQNNGLVAGISLSFNNNILINSYSNYLGTAVQFWDVINTKIISTAWVYNNNRNNLRDVEFSNDGKYIYTNGPIQIITLKIGYEWMKI